MYSVFIVPLAVQGYEFISSAGEHAWWILFHAVGDGLHVMFKCCDIRGGRAARFR